MHKIVVAAAIVAAMLASSSAARAASIWTQVPSGTTSDITGIAYQSDTRFWYVTSLGEIFTHQPNGTFVRTFGPSGIALNDIAFQSSGNVGIAVGDNGQALRSNDAGATWQNVNPGGTPIPVSKKSTTFADCTASEPLGDVNSVRFAGDGRAWLFAQGAQMAKSEPANAANVGVAGTWVDANRSGTNTCKLQTSYGDGIDDGFFFAANPDVGYFCTAFFGELFFSANDLATTATKKSADCGNGDLAKRRMTGDPANPNHQWAVGPGGANLSYMHYTSDGWSTASNFTLVNPDAHGLGTPYDVAFAGGTTVAVGDAGMILNNTDGTGAFYNNAADGALATEAWHAVGAASASQVAIGGAGGVLAVTTQANTTPDVVPPTGTIVGPTTAVVGSPTQYGVNAADNAGGSGINAGSFVWSAVGTAGATGNPANITFPNPGLYTLNVAFADNAGNPASATITVQVSTIPPGTANPTPSKTIIVPGGTVKLSGPKTCVAPGKAFTATLSFKKRRTNARRRVIKVTKVFFFIDGKRAKIDRKAPFRQTLSVRSYVAGSTHTLKARAFLKVRHGRSPTKSISTSFQVCSS
jgi:photosystem II stability/assembly factor-like uncharacterized protein